MSLIVRVISFAIYFFFKQEMILRTGVFPNIWRNALANVGRHEAHILFVPCLPQPSELNSGAILEVAAGMFPLGEPHLQLLNTISDVWTE